MKIISWCISTDMTNYDDIILEDIIINEEDTNELDFLDDIFNVKF